MVKKASIIFILGLVIFCSLPFLPITRENESYRSFFPKDHFLTKLNAPTPKWMEEQIEKDFSPFDQVTPSMVEVTFEKVKEHFLHYRIIGNCLYKRLGGNGRISSKDTEFEKALKTLLIYAKLPDVEFIYCPMDGLPEKYMAEDFYLVGDAKLQAPIFAKARLKSAPYIILLPDQFSLSEKWFEDSKEVLENDIEWEEKQEIALWRGGFTDIGVPNGTVLPENYSTLPRYLICKLDSELIDAKLPWAGSVEFDQIIRNDGVWGHIATKKQHLDVKYLPVLDGHMCTYPGYQWRLLSNSVAFKQESEEEQWFYSALKPFVHYVPIKNDMSDLEAKVQWAKIHDSETRAIAKNGREFALHHLMIEDDYYYLYLSLLKYAKVQVGEFKNQEQFQCIQYRKRSRMLKSFFKKIRAYFGGSNGKCATNINGVLLPK